MTPQACLCPWPDSLMVIEILCFCLLERELPVGLDQRLITWETVQKENYLAKLERQHWESSEEKLKSTSSK